MVAKLWRKSCLCRRRHNHDWRHTASLYDVGQPDYLAAAVIAADGRQDLLLAAIDDDLNPLPGTYDRTTPAAPHEQLGPLPARYQRGLRTVPIRCGRPTCKGRPCRNRVDGPGQACEWHRSTQPANDGSNR